MTSISKSGQLVIKRRGAQVRRDSLATSPNFEKNLYYLCFAGKKKRSPFFSHPLPSPTAMASLKSYWDGHQDLSPQVFVQHGD